MKGNPVPRLLLKNHNSPQPEHSSRTSSTNSGNPKIARPRTPNSGDTILDRNNINTRKPRTPPWTSQSSSQNIFDFQSEEVARPRSRRRSPSPTPARSSRSARTSEESRTPSTEYSSRGSYPGASGGRRDWRRGNRGRLSPPPKMVEPVRFTSGSESGM